MSHCQYGLQDTVRCAPHSVMGQPRRELDLCSGETGPQRCVLYFALIRVRLGIHTCTRDGTHHKCIHPAVKSIQDHLS